MTVKFEDMTPEEIEAMRVKTMARIAPPVIPWINFRMHYGLKVLRPGAITYLTDVTS